MARALESTGNCRNVLIGDSDAPTALHTEYRVVDGDMAEAPKRKTTSTPDFNKTMATIWTETIAAVKSDEGLS